MPDRLVNVPYSLGLTLYNLGSSREVVAGSERPARPAGRLIWLHAPGAEAARPLLALARRLVEEDGHPVLLTCPAELAPRAGVTLQRPPGESAAEVRAFLDHWRPEIAVLSEGELRPVLLQEARVRGIPLVMVEARSPYILRERQGWWPGLVRGQLAGFRQVLALDEQAARTFRKAGAPVAAVQVSGRMEEDSAALPCNEAERAALARSLATRPVWLAAGLPEAEETAVIEAHALALRLAHRLLLIVVPLDPARAGPLAARMEAEQGWAVARRSADAEPEPETEVYLADTDAEYGLWYRLAPIAFLGGSLAGAGASRNPLEAAALGSALLHGPRPGVFGATFGRLGAARAARAVTSGADLGEALGDLLSPDRAARLAQAAWGVASDGAEVTAEVVALIRRVMDGES